MILKVSIIIPVYNAEIFLEKCVSSLTNQTLRDVEIILVDDGSTDNCPAMCDASASLDDRIKIIHQKNSGSGYARNAGLEIATGEYIAFVDADDYVEPEMFEVMYDMAKKNHADFVRVDNYKETAEGKILNLNYRSPLREGNYNKEQLRKKLLEPQLGMLPEETGDRYVSCSLWRNIYRREIIEKNSLRFVSERELLSEDTIFNFDFMMQCEVAYVINKKFYHYVINDKSQTQTYHADQFAKELKLYYALEDRLKATGIYDECELRLQRYLLARGRKCIKSELCNHAAQGKNEVRKILNSKELQVVLEKYPIFQLPLKYKVVCYLMKYKMVWMLGVIKRKL